MTIYEGLSLCISLLALLFSYKANNKSNKLQIKANNLQKNQSELAAIQKAQIEKEMSKANCQIELIKGNGTKYEFKITNISQTNAHDVDIAFIGYDKKPDFIKWEKYKDKFPVDTLSPTQSVSIFTHRSLSSPPSYKISLSWHNPDGSIDSKKITLIPE